MFRRGGVAGFPDLSGDGQVTQKDILMGRGVIKMQEGGMAPMPAAPGPAAMMPPGMGGMAGPGPEVMAGAVGQLDPASIDINAAAQGAMQQGLDPAMLEGMLGQYASQLEDLDNAQDYEQVINGIRGDTAPLEQRYMELAGIVGQEDAQQTPESVLALVQPVMLLASVDQGIGGLAMEEMNAPVEGAMAEGIMSTVNMGGTEPTQGVGGPAPVNFSQGGPVVYMQDGGTPLGGRLGELYGERQELFQSILSPQDSAQELQEQTDLTKAQMLFDIAQGALMFASPTERRMSPAERLAQSFTPVLGSISERAGELEKFKQGQRREERALNLEALGSADTALAAERTIESQRNLQEAANRFAASESRLDRAHDITVKNMEFDFQNKDRLSQQEFTERLQDLKFQNDQALLGLQGEQDREAIQLRNKLEQDNMRLGSELRIAENLLSFEQQLERDGILNTYELGRMDKGHAFNKELASHKAALEREAQEFQNAFTAAENALDRIQQSNLQASDQTFRMVMQEEMQKFTSDQNEIDRAIAKVNRQFDNKIALRRAAQGDRQLDQGEVELGIKERAQVLDEAYKLGQLALDQAAAKAVSVGSDAKTDELSYLTNAERMRKYAQGELGDETALYEQALLDYTAAKDVWDPEIGKFVKGSAGRLSPQVLENVRQGNPDLYTQITGTQLTPTGQPAPAPKVNLMNATSEILNPDGTVNPDSPVWETTPPYLFDPSVDYRQVVGASRVLPGIGKMFSEGAAELFGGDASPEAKSMAKAATSLDNLANDILQYNTSDTDSGRILKFVQELIERETRNIRPGGLFLKTDADAQAALESVASTLKQQLQLGASVLPEYGGTPGNYTEKQITGARRDMQKLKVLYNEVRAFQEGFGFEPTVRSPETGADQSTDTARSQILRMRRQNSGG